MADIHAFPGSEHLINGEPAPDVVEALEAALERARSGALRSFAMVTILGYQNCTTEWAGSDGWYHEITSGIVTLQYRWLRDNLPAKS